MKSKAAFLFILLFLLICLVPSAGMLFFGPSGALANEIPARTPEPVQEGKPNMAYLTELTDYVSDTFFLRRELITGFDIMNPTVFCAATSSFSAQTV